MALLYYIPVFFCLASCVSADNWDDFANNLATDLAPLITLFGEQITRQCMSELIDRLDDFIFALAPLGVLTAVVSAIRVCGNSTLQAVIGRAQEDPASSEKEILSCVSISTGEIFTESGVARITGNPKILEIVVDETQAQSGVVTVRKVSEVAGKNWADLEKDVKSPNLSLNKGIRRRAPFWFHLAATFGVILQLCIILYAALTVMYKPQSFLKNGSPVDSYAFPMYVLGTVLLTMGMFLCAVLVERHSLKEFCYLSEGDRAYWIQPGNQTAGDQKFPSFVGRTEKGVMFIRSVRHESPNSLFKLGKEMELILVVGLTMVGFVIQFVGIRGLHSSVILAQLGATMVMTLVRTGLRAGRMQEGDNMLKGDEQRIVSNDEHELDWLGFRLFNIGSFWISPPCSALSSISQAIIRESITTRTKLRKLAGSDWNETPVCRSAQILGQATQKLMQTIVTWPHKKKPPYFDITIPMGIQKKDDMQEISENWQTRLFVDKNIDSKFWEPIIGFYVWSLKHQNDILSEEAPRTFFRTFTIKDRSDHHAQLLYQKWTNEPFILNKDRSMANSFLCGCQTFGILQHRTMNPITDGAALIKVPSDLYMLAAQDIFSHILHSVLDNFDGSDQSTSLTGINKHDYQLRNDLVDTLAEMYQSSGLGTRNEGLLCILPVLADRNLLQEIPSSAFEVCQDRRHLGNHQERSELHLNYTELYVNYNELVTVSEWLCSLADYGEIEYLLNEYGYISLTGLLLGIGDEDIAIERLVAIMKADQNHPVSISSYVDTVASIPPLQWRKDFQNQISWLALRLVQHQARSNWDLNTAHKLNKFQEVLGPDYALCGTQENAETAVLCEKLLCNLWFSSNSQSLPEGIKDYELVIDWLSKNDYQTILDMLLLWLRETWSSNLNYKAMTELVQYVVLRGYKKAIFSLSRNVESSYLWHHTIERLAMDGEVQTIETLLEHTHPYRKRRCYETAHLVAAEHKQTALLKLTLQNGVDVDIQDGEGETALMKAAMQNDIQSIRILLVHGAQLERTNIALDTALILAAESGHLDAATILVEKGANVNAVVQSGRTALMAAVRRNSLETIRFLVEHGADIHVKDFYGDTALDRARNANENGRMEEVCNFLERVGTRQLAN